MAPLMIVAVTCFCGASVFAWLSGYFTGYHHGYDFARDLSGEALPSYETLVDELP